MRAKDLFTLTERLSISNNYGTRARVLAATMHIRTYHNLLIHVFSYCTDFYLCSTKYDIRFITGRNRTVSTQYILQMDSYCNSS